MNASVRLACGPFLAEILASRGYRTFGVGKFHTWPRDADIGYETHLRSEELYDTPEERRRDAYAGFIASEHPEYDFVEFLMGERSEMYHIPQMSPLPAAVGVEAWAADRACELIRSPDRRPFFGMVSFIGPHPPYAPPIPFNRYYDPDAMPAPVLGDMEEDHRDEQIPWLNYVEFADEISAGLARLLKARYYGEITYIDGCVGRILDALEERPDAEDTLLCFFSDHGDCMGDHHAWEKENFFEASARVPLLVSWPERLTEGRNRSELVCLTDLFGLATSATGEGEMRDGADLLGWLEGRAPMRERAFGLYGEPGSPRFKVMVREGVWKYIYLANGGFEQLFDVSSDPSELVERRGAEPGVAESLRRAATEELMIRKVRGALDDAGRELRKFPFVARPLRRSHRFDASRGVIGYGVGPVKAWG